MPHLPWRSKNFRVEDQQLQSVPYDSLVGEDQPKDLWDRAHRLLRDDKSNRQLLVAYERILLSELNEVASPSTSVNWGSRDRRRQVSDLIVKKLKVIEDTRWRLQLGKETVKVKAQVDKVVKTVIWAQGFVSSAISADPHAALAWAGVSLLLPLLLNPTSQNKALIDGLDYISTLIARFTVIEGIYQQHISTRSATSGSNDKPELERSFEMQVTKLYSQILAYQARVVCQLPRNALVRYGRDVLKADDWSTMLAEIKTTESSCSAISDVVSTEKIDASWREQERRMDDLFRSQEEHYWKLQHTTDQIAADLKQAIEEQRGWHRTDEESLCLQALCNSTYEDRKNRNPDRVPGTCQWFLNNDKFHEWAENDSSDLLWVTADPGCGKSVLSKSLVDSELESTLSLTTAYFFFKDDSPEQRSATHAVCALLHQLCIQNRALLRIAVGIYQKNGSQLTLSFAWVWDLLLAVTQHPEAGEVVCILDALDECEERDKETLISSLNGLYASQESFEGRLKFLITSRPYYDIEESFDQNTLRLAGEDESDTIKYEIDLVIKERVSKIASRKRLDPKTRAALQDRLLQTENRTYLWLHLTLDRVERGFGLATPKKMRAFIDELPRTINQAYEAMLDRSPQPEQARKLLHIVLAAVRPLDLREMNMALNIEEGQASRKEVDFYPENSFGTYVKNLCGLLVSIFDARIYLLHQTVKEFLLPRAMTSGAIKRTDSVGVWKHSMEPSESNLVLASTCLYYLSFAVFDEDTSRDEYNPEKNYDFLIYAALYWQNHFKFAREERRVIELWYHVCDMETRRFNSWYQVWLQHENKHDLKLKPIVRKTSPLMLASTFGHDVIVRQLTEGKAEREFEDWCGMTPLMSAAKYGHEIVVSSLIRVGALLEAQDFRLLTPLAYAATYGHEHVVRVLINEGAIIDSNNFNGETPLSLAAYHGNHLVVKVLIDAGAQVATPDKNGWTPLMAATAVGHPKVVEMLLKTGKCVPADTLRYTQGLTLLHQAAYMANETVVKMLLGAGCSPDSTDNEGITPLGLAKSGLGPESTTQPSNHRRSKLEAVIKLLEPVTSK